VERRGHRHGCGWWASHGWLIRRDGLTANCRRRSSPWCGPACLKPADTPS
jgi:hypothetical protein